MRKLVPVLFVAVALTATGVALSSGSPNDRLASQTRVFGGGQFAFPNGVERSFAIDDHVDGHGAGAAYGTWEYGPPDGPWHVRADITCTTVAGSTAIVGGTITSSEIPDFVGLAFLTYLRDDGTPATGARDQASVSYFGTSDGLPGDFPTTFPQTCPDAPFADLPPIWGDVSGDVVVQP